MFSTFQSNDKNKLYYREQWFVSNKCDTPLFLLLRFILRSFADLSQDTILQ